EWGVALVAPEVDVARSARLAHRGALRIHAVLGAVRVVVAERALPDEAVDRAVVVVPAGGLPGRDGDLPDDVVGVPNGGGADQLGGHSRARRSGAGGAAGQDGADDDRADDGGTERVAHAERPPGRGTKIEYRREHRGPDGLLG